MEIKAKAKFIRMSPRKVRLMVNVVRGLGVGKALDQLNFSAKWASKPVTKLINSAVANATNNFNLDADNLFVKEIRVDEGPVLKRWTPKAHGRATQILKKTSHINLILGEFKPTENVQPKKVKIEEPIKLDAHPKGEDSVEIKEEKERGATETNQEKGKKIADPKKEGRRGHQKVEGGSKKGFVNKMFQRKSG